MSYRRETIIRVTDMFKTKPANARAMAQKRREEVSSLFPEIKNIDMKLEKTGSKIFAAISAGGSDMNAKLEELKKENLMLQAEKGDILASHGFPRDYTHVKYECNLCSDTGYVGIDMCSCMKKALNEDSFLSSGLGRLAQTQDFTNFAFSRFTKTPKAGKQASEYDIMLTNYNSCLAYADSFGNESGSLLFIGGTGLGKTHLSGAIGKAVIKKGYHTVYESAPNILLAFERERFGKSQDIDTGKYFTCDLLIIDDLGTEFANRVALSDIYNIINSRLVDGRPMIISTNLNYVQLEKQYEPRMISRLFGEFKVLLFEGVDYRRAKV